MDVMLIFFGVRIAKEVNLVLTCDVAARSVASFDNSHLREVTKQVTLQPALGRTFDEFWILNSQAVRSR